MEGDGVNGGGQGVSDGSCGPIMQHMMIFNVSVLRAGLQYPCRGLEVIDDLEGIASDLGEMSCVSGAGCKTSHRSESGRRFIDERLPCSMITSW
jgi:hypothetical protein